MKTTPVQPADLARSVISVPPLARRPDLSLDPAANRALVRHLEVGGVTTLMYGGNANFYHIGLKQFSEALTLLAESAGADSWVIPSVGPEYGRLLDQLPVLREHDAFPTVMVLPLTFPATPEGVATGVRRFAPRRRGDERAARRRRGGRRGLVKDVLDAIGETSLVPLREVVPPGCAEVWVKLEWENPTGSLKDRMAHAVIARAEQDGRLKPGGTVVEYTGGSTGASLAWVCAARGYRIRIVSSDAFSPEKLDQMAAFGAELTLVPSEGGRTTKKLILDMIETARGLSREPNTFWTDQLRNADSLAGYHGLGEEIWSQTRGAVDAFVHCVGTGASSRGVATALKRRKPGVRIVTVEPAESSVLLGGQAGPHTIEGVGVGFTPPLWDPTVVDEILPVASEEAKDMARRLAREEALFGGTSSGANVVAAIRVAERLGPGATVVTLMADSGLKYLNTDVYRAIRAPA